MLCSSLPDSRFHCRHPTLLPTNGCWELIHIPFPFSRRCSSYVCGTVTPPITALLISLLISCVNDRTIKIVVAWDKPQQQQASWANVMHNMDALIKLPGIGSGNRSSMICKITFFFNKSPWVFSLHMYNNTMSTSGTWNSSYMSVPVHFKWRTNRSW